jgi:hypothetical protein
VLFPAGRSPRGRPLDLGGSGSLVAAVGTRGQPGTGPWPVGPGAGRQRGRTDPSPPRLPARTPRRCRLRARRPARRARAPLAFWRYATAARRCPDGDRSDHALRPRATAGQWHRMRRGGRLIAPQPDRSPHGDGVQLRSVIGNALRLRRLSR